MTGNLGKHRDRLARTVHTLHTVSPLATLDRGYAIVTDRQSGKILRDAGLLKPGREVGTRLASGSFSAKVTGIITGKDEK